MRENTRGYRRKTVNLHVELVSDECSCFVAYQTINGGDTRYEVSALLEAGIKVFMLLFVVL